MTLSISRRKFVQVGGTTLIAASVPAVAPAQTAYPNKQITIVVPWPPGGTTDLAGRLVATHLSSRLDQPVIVDNKPGGNTTIGTNVVAKAAPDGYTLLMNTGATLTSAFVKNIPFEILRDLAPVSMAYQGTYVLFAGKNLPFQTMTEMIAWAKANPGKLTVGSPAPTSLVALEVLKSAADINFTIGPDTGSAATMNDLLGGHVMVVLDGPTTYTPHVKAGTIRALATAADRRVETLPNVPTTAEAGWPQLRATFLGGLWAPAKTPPAIIERLSREMTGVMKEPDVRAKLIQVGVDPSSSTPLEMRDKIQSEMEHYARGAKLANYEPQ